MNRVVRKARNSVAFIRRFGVFGFLRESRSRSFIVTRTSAIASRITITNDVYGLKLLARSSQTPGSPTRTVCGMNPPGMRQSTQR